MKLPGQHPRWSDLLAFLFWNWLFTQALGAEPRFFVVTETRHVLRSESPGNLREAKLSVARNEWGSFQVLVRAEAPIRGLSLQANLTGPDSRSTDAIQVRLCRQHQLVLDTGTYRNADFKPDGYPDPLIPFGHPVKAGREAEPTNWAAIETECAQVLSDHRLNAVPPGETIRPVSQPDGSFRIPAEQVEALRQFVDRYHVNAVQIPHPSEVIKDPEAERDRLRAWLAAFDVVAKELSRDHLVFYTYLRDEPNTLEDYQYVQEWGRAIREAKSVVKALVYPGHAVGCDGVVPTIRLKALRDGIEDYDYLALLERQGQAPAAEAIVAPLAGSFFAWNRDPAAYEKARAALAALILNESKGR